MDKKRIAVIFGGNSTEYEVSLQSAFSVLENIDTDKYDVFPVGITRKGAWYHYTGENGKISGNTWLADRRNLFPVTVSHGRLAYHKNRSGISRAAWKERGGRHAAGAV